MTVTWAGWSLQEWNERLIRHVLCVPGDACVTRIPASADELWLIAGRPQVSPGDAAAWFCSKVVDALYGGADPKGFCGFANAGTWDPSALSPPPYFVLLWLTCLIASGYPEVEEGEFAERIRHPDALGRAERFRTDGETCLPSLWEKLAAWTAARNAAGDSVRVLRLPPPSAHRKVIGYSHFLAFPGRRDRILMAEVLGNAGLIGYEPPIRPVLEVLRANAKGFSREFRDDLNDFVGHFQQGEDSQHSPFWRAIRDEALSPALASGDQREAHTKQTTQLRFITHDDQLVPVVACLESFEPPGGIVARPVEGWGAWPCCLEADDRDYSRLQALIFEQQELVDVGTANLIRQGMLILRAVSSDEYEPTAGLEIEDCNVALVQSNYCAAFIGAFGGVREETSIDGWFAIRDCSVQLLDEAPAELSKAYQLLKTMVDPRIRVVGGVRIDDGFLNHPACLPSIEASGAELIELKRENEAAAINLAAGGEAAWKLPTNLSDGTYKITAIHHSGGGVADRVSSRTLTLVDHAVSATYKGAPSGFYRVEGCCPEEHSFEGPGPVPLMITAQQWSAAADLLHLDSTVRYLGPGLGEMSTDLSCGFQWAAIGPKGRPEALLYIGESAEPLVPSKRRSPDSGDRSHWRHAFRHARAVVWRRADGVYGPIDTAPLSVRDLYGKYRSHSLSNDSEPCPVTHLANHDWTQVGEPGQGVASQALDVIAALSCRRRGLSYPIARDYFGGVVGATNPYMFDQVLRAWTECGVVDQLRGTLVGRRTIVMRRPHFALVQRGPLVDATLIGWLPSSSVMELKRRAESLRQNITWLQSPSAYQPSLPRIVAAKPESIEELSRQLGMEPPEWLSWDSKQMPAAFNAAETLASLNSGEPPDGFEPYQLWNWDAGRFTRGSSAQTEAITLEKRLRKDMTAVYVVRSTDAAPKWTYSREWAVLAAHISNGKRPFAKTAHGMAAVAGSCSVHLPLPLGRLCTLVGPALPGPRFSVNGVLASYMYPFGDRLAPLVRRVIPADWIAE